LQLLEHPGIQPDFNQVAGLPVDFPPWSTVYKFFAGWEADGIGTVGGHPAPRVPTALTSPSQHAVCC